jgi:hypothetical protein
MTPALEHIPGELRPALIGERIALARMRDDVDNLPLHQHKRKVVRDWIMTAIESVERDLNDSATPSPASEEASNFKLVGKVDFHMSAEMDVRIGEELYIRASTASEEVARLREALTGVLLASEKACRGIPVPRWAGHENGLGEEFGTELDAALIAARTALESTK